MRRASVGWVLAMLSVGGVLNAQQPIPQQQPPTQSGQGSGGVAPTGSAQSNAADHLRPNYVFQVGDQILLRAFEMPEVGDSPFRVDSDGFLNLPELGRVKAAGITLENLEAALVELAKQFVRTPQVTVTVVHFSSEPVFFVGAFKAPGIYPLGAQRNLVELMSAIGGLLPTANRRIKVTRRKEYGAIPLPETATAPDGSSTSVEIKMASLRDNLNRAEDIVLQPFDVISVDKAEKVYVTGEVTRVGAFDLLERDSISVLQAVTLAGGLSPSANLKNASILRPVPNTSQRAEIPLNLQRILKGQDCDRPLLPNDVLYVPRNSGVKNMGRALLVVLPMAATVAAIMFSVYR
jgi:polysaccharide export outer membrane protein